MLVDGSVRRPVRAWTKTVHALLRHLEQRGFSGAPRALGIDDRGREVLSYLEGETVGDSLPWPAWTHSGAALDDVGRWLREYHRAVADHVPAVDAVWREGEVWKQGLIIGHGDPVPYNAVWDRGGLVGFIDWDMAGPVASEDDLAWLAFSWTPLHARAVVAREGFTEFSERRVRLERLLNAYGWEGTTEDVLRRIDARLRHRADAIRATAEGGDPVYQQMLASGLDRLLECARKNLASL